MSRLSLLAGAALFALAASASQAQAAAFISNGVLALGVHDTAELNVGSTEGGTPGSGPYPGNSLGGVDPVGLRFLPPGGGGYASTEPGCVCEGWGVAIKSLNITGHANRDDGAPVNLSIVSFSATNTTATSVVRIKDAAGADMLEVRHHYAPSAATPNLYQVTVGIKNISGADIAAGDLLYRRVMDWDVEPTPFDEFVTIQGVPALLGVANGNNVNATSNDGFQRSDPLVPVNEISPFPGINTNFTDAGSADHGAMFQFEFEALADGATREFAIFYGAAESEAAADAARLAAGVGLYSYGQCDNAVNPACDPATGTPVTFIFGFGAKGGVLEPPPPTGEVPAPATLALFGAAAAGLAAIRRRKSA